MDDDALDEQQLTLGDCSTCGQPVLGYDLVTGLLPMPEGAGPRSIVQVGPLDDSSSIITLIPCGCHILGQATDAISLMFQALRRTGRGE